MNPNIDTLEIKLDSSHLFRVEELTLTYVSGKGWRIEVLYKGFAGSYPFFIDSKGYSYIGWSLHSVWFKGGDPGNYFKTGIEKMIELALKLTEEDFKHASDKTIDRANPAKFVLMDWKKYNDLIPDLVSTNVTIDEFFNQCITKHTPALDWNIIKLRKPKNKI